VKRPVVAHKYAWIVVVAAGLWAAPAAEASEPTVRVASHTAGEDLAMWGELSQRRPTGEAAVQAYRDFVLAWPDSPLAEAAWDRLVALQAASIEADTPAARQALARVKARWTERQRTLAIARRRAGPRVVLDLDDAAGATALVPLD